MYRSCVVETKPLWALAHARRTTWRMLSVCVALATAVFALTNPLGGCVGLLRAAEMPRFIAQQQLGPLQQALLAYTAQGTTGEAPDRPGFGAAASNHHPGEGMPPELLGAPQLVTDRLNQLTTTEFRSTLNAARRDAGEARALADEMSRSAAEIKDRFRQAGDPDLARKMARDDTRSRPVIFEPAITQITALGRGEVGAMGIEIGRGAAKLASHNSAERISAPVSSVKVLPTRRNPAGSQPVEAGVFDPPQAPDAPMENRQATDVVEAVASAVRPAPKPLPGLMSLGGSKSNQTASIDRAGLPIQADMPAAGVVTNSLQGPDLAAESQSSNNSGVVNSAAAYHPLAEKAADGATPVEPSGSKRTRAKTGKSSASLSAAAAYGYVPLLPPKDRAAKHIKAQSDSAVPLPERNVVSGASRGGRGQLGRKPATSVANSAMKPSSRPVPASASAQLGAGGNIDEKKEATGLFSWLKPLGKPFEMPREIKSYGWSSE